MTYKPVRSTPVIVQNRDALECIAGLVKATGSIFFNDNPINTKILTIYGEVFEFLLDLGDLTPGNIGVQIGVDLVATRDNLLTALAELTRVQVDTPLVAAVASGTNTILLTYWEVGTVGNDVITTDDVSVGVTGMSGGIDGSGVIVGNPTYGYDLAPVNDAYQIILTTPDDGRYRHNICFRCETNDMIISLDSGTTEHLYAVAGDKPTWLGNLLIAPNKAIRIKNADTGQNYAKAAISVW